MYRDDFKSMYIHYMYIHVYLNSILNERMEIEKELQQTRFKSNLHKAMLNLMFTASWVGCRQQRFFKEHDLSPQQYNVLRILRGQKGNPITMNGIQERMIDRSSNASRLIDKLQEKELADRITCEKDRRQVDIVITQKGLALLEELDPEIDDVESAYGNITDEEAVELNRILNKLRG